MAGVLTTCEYAGVTCNCQDLAELSQACHASDKKNYYDDDDYYHYVVLEH